jgi:hypothetical protein
MVLIYFAEVEYVIATSTSYQAMWLRRILNDMSHTEKEPTPIFCDNTSAIDLSKKPRVSKENHTY